MRVGHVGENTWVMLVGNDNRRSTDPIVMHATPSRRLSRVFTRDPEDLRISTKHTGRELTPVRRECDRRHAVAIRVDADQCFACRCVPEYEVSTPETLPGAPAPGGQDLSIRGECESVDPIALPPEDHYFPTRGKIP